MSKILGPFTQLITETAPAWFAGMADHQWLRLATNADFLAVGAPPLSTWSTNGLSLVMGAWNGALVDQVRGEYLLIKNGGHNGYSGNEVYAFRVKQATPRWYRLTNHTPDSQMAAMNGPESPYNARIQYLDGLPRARQSYNQQCYAEGYNCTFDMATSAYTAGVTGTADNIWKFDRAACGDDYSVFVGGGGSGIPYATVAANGGNGPNGIHQYIRGAWNTQPIFDYEAPCAAWDYQNNQALGFHKQPDNNPTNRCWAIDPTSPYALTYYDSGRCAGTLLNWVQCTNNLSPNVAIAGDVQSRNIFVWNLANRGGSQFVQRIPSGSIPFSAYGAGWYGVWHPGSYSILMYEIAAMGSQTGVIRLAMDNPADPVNTSWTYSMIAGSGSAPGSTGTPTYSRTQLIRDMGDGRSCLVTGQYNVGVWAFRLPLTGL